LHVLWPQLLLHCWCSSPATVTLTLLIDKGGCSRYPKENNLHPQKPRVSVHLNLLGHTYILCIHAQVLANFCARACVP
jgi:hypothetical protein